MKKILIIEDEPEIVDLLKNRLESCGYSVLSAFDGMDGFSKFSEEHPDLVILDLMLPKISGYEVSRRIRIEKESKTPILMLTAKNESADKIIGRLRGANTYMTKPFCADELIHQVRLLLVT